MNEAYTYAVSSYKDHAFMGSEQARHIRILCELEGSKTRLERNNVQATVLIFGSARAKSTAQYDAEVTNLTSKGKTAEIEKLQSKKWMCEYYDKVEQIAMCITKWACTNESEKLDKNRRISGVSRSKSMEKVNQAGQESSELDSSPNKDGLGLGLGLGSGSGLGLGSGGVAGKGAADEPSQKVLVCTGGGPGFMEAANKGAASVPNSRNMGMGITLPFEAGLNRYVTDDLAFQYHYFFTRKFWMVYHCQALIAAPGGVGTLDELFEVLTLKQTGKIHKDLPVVLLGKEFWSTVVNWEALVNYGVINEADVKNLFFTDSVEEACSFIIKTLTTANKE